MPHHRWCLIALALVCWVARVHAAQPPQHVGESPANEATIVRLPDDSLRIYHVLRPAGTEIRSIGSTDNGKIWADDRLEFKLPGIAYYAVQVLVDSDGELQACFHIQGKGDKGYNGRHYDVWHVKTSGGRKTWGEPKRIFEGYVGSMRGFAQLKSGRIVVPVAIAVPDRVKKPEGDGPDYGWHDVAVVYSDDKGDTWQQSSSRLKVLQDNTRGKTRYGGVEPHVVQLADGRVWMLVRTKNGHLYESFSSDGIEWPELKPSTFISSDSPATTVRLKDGRLALFLNQCQRWDDPMSYAIGGREVLHAAISSDDGKSWHGFREVLYDFAGNAKGDRGTAYPSAVESADGAIVLVSGQGDGRKSVLRLDPAWLSETSATSTFADGEWPRWTTHDGKGAEVIAHPDNPDAKCLAVRRTGADAPAVASWNFPIAPAGKLALRVKPKAGFTAAILSLTDHYSVSGDTKADSHAVYCVKLDGKAITADAWHDVELQWPTGGGDATVSVDGKSIASIRQLRSPALGINYIRVGNADEVGFLVESAKATGSDAAAGADDATKPKLTIVAFGDSITRGARPSRGGAPRVAENETFVAEVQTRLNAAGIVAVVVNAGIGGNRTDQGVARLDAQVLARRPDIVTIMFGTNDACYDEGKTQPRLTPGMYEANLRQIVQRTRDAGAKPILLTPPPLTMKWPLATKQRVYREQGVNGPLTAYVDTVRRVARETDVPLVDFFAAWSGKSADELDALMPDGCHPGVTGHKLMADLIMPALLAQSGHARSAGAPLSFTKHPGGATGGAVLDIGGPGAFDAKWTTCPTILRDAGGVYRMWYSANYNAAGGLGGIGLATSTDGRAWSRQNGGKPVLSFGADGAFDDAQILGPEVLRDGNRYLMWYTGDNGEKDASGIFHYQIGLATSEDGVMWTRGNDGKPVLANGPAGSFDEVQAATPSILREGDGYRMWYAAWARATNHTICVARSGDGVTWRRENDGRPVDGLNPSIAFGHSVCRVGERYVMLYMALSASRCLYAATSDDGLHWSMLNGGAPVLSPGSECDFDASTIGHPFLLAENDVLRCWYTGYQTKPGGIGNWELRIGYADGPIPAGLTR